MLTIAGLATAVTETLKVDGRAFAVERLLITDAGRRAIWSNVEEFKQHASRLIGHLGTGEQQRRPQRKQVLRSVELF
jgi:hypothetical protein